MLSVGLSWWSRLHCSVLKFHVTLENPSPDVALTTLRLLLLICSFQFRSAFSNFTPKWNVCSCDLARMTCYNLDKHEPILILFGSQKMLNFSTSPSQCFCTTWKNTETQKSLSGVATGCAGCAMHKGPRCSERPTVESVFLVWNRRGPPSKLCTSPPPPKPCYSTEIATVML